LEKDAQIFDIQLQCQRIDVGAGKDFCTDSPNLPEKNFKKVVSKKIKKALLVNSGAIIFKSKHVGRHFCSDFQGVEF